VCGRLAEGDLDALALQIILPDIEGSGTRIRPRVREETLTEHHHFRVSSATTGAWSLRSQVCASITVRQEVNSRARLANT
jgi:hypothetical protein